MLCVLFSKINIKLFVLWDFSFSNWKDLALSSSLFSTRNNNHILFKKNKEKRERIKKTIFPHIHTKARAGKV
jgi:hypothetical protein